MTKEVFSRVLDYKTGLTGASVLSALTIKYGAFQGFICQDYTVVQVITDAQGNDVTAQMGLRGVTLSPGIYISMAKGDSIYSIILSSGSIILYDLGADMSSVPGVSDLITAFSTRASVDGATLESTSCIDGPLMPYFKKASFYLTPSAYKGGKLYAQKPITGNGDLTWTRGGDGFRTNSSGLVQRVPWNLVQYSEQFDNAVWTKTNTTVTANTATAPNGTTTADTITIQTTPGNRILQYITVTANTTYTFSFYALRGTATDLTYSVYNFSTSGNIVASTSYYAQTNSSTWSRISVTFTTPTGCTSIGVYPVRDASSTGTFFIWGAQLVEGTTAQTYLPTTDRLGFPRLDYTYGTCPAALLEPQRTNLALQSETFDNASWSKTASSVTANSTTSPSGVVDADTLTADGTSSRHDTFFAPSVTSGTNYTYSVYAKKGTNDFLQLSTGGGFGSNAFANFDLNTGVIGTIGSAATATITALGNGWYRCTMTAPATITGGTGIYNLIVTSSTASRLESNTLTTSVFLWGAQFEVGAYPTTYIPTTSATTTRIADSFSRSNIYTNGLISAAGGTWFVELRNNVAYTRDGGSTSLAVSTTSGDVFASSTGIEILNNLGLNRLSIIKRISGTATSLYLTTTDTVKIAVKWNGTSADVFVNGTKQVSATAFTTTNMEFLKAFGADVPKFIQQMALFPTPLTDTECAAMTTI